MAGLGFAKAPVEMLAEDLTTSPEQLNSAVTPIAPEIDVLGVTSPPPAAKEPPLIDFGENPLGAIGAVLTNVARGARGQPLFTEELKNRRLQQEDRELKRATVGVDAMSKGLELLKNTPAAARGDVIQQYGKLFEGIIPGFTATLEQAAQSPDATETQLQALGEHAPILISMAGSLEGALELAQKPALMKQLNETADLRNQPEITQAFQRVDKILKASPEGQKFLAQAAADGFTLSDLQDPKIQEAFGLEQSHVNSIARSPEIQSSLRPFGFIPTTDLDEQAKAKASEKSLSRIAQEQAVKTRAQENENIVPYQNADTGEVRRARQGDAAALKAQGFEPIVTGRTESDAANREERKREGKESAPINGFVSSVLGMDPNTSIKEFRDAGGNPDFEAKDIRNLQTLEAGFKNAEDTVERAKALIRQSPDANAFGGRLASAFGNLRQNLTSVGRLLGADVAGKVDEEFKRVAPIMDELGVQSAELRSLVLDLSYMAAVSRGQEGRGLSDNDVRRFSQIIGTGQADPDQFEELVDSVIVRFDQAFRNNFESIARKRPDSLLQDVQKAESLAERIDAGEEVTAEDLQALSPRARKELRLMMGKPQKKK